MLKREVLFEYELRELQELQSQYKCLTQEYEQITGKIGSCMKNMHGDSDRPGFIGSYYYAIGESRKAIDKSLQILEAFVRESEMIINRLNMENMETLYGSLRDTSWFSKG